MSRTLDLYPKNWPRVGAVAAMALGGASVLVASGTYDVTEGEVEVLR